MKEVLEFNWPSANNSIWRKEWKGGVIEVPDELMLCHENNFLLEKRFKYYDDYKHLIVHFFGDFIPSMEKQKAQDFARVLKKRNWEWNK